MCRKIHEDKAGIRCHPQHCTARRRKARLLRSMMRGDTATRLHSRTARTYHCRHHQTSQRDTAHPLGLWIPRDSTNRQHTCTAGTLLHPLHCNAQHHTTLLSRSWIQPGMSTQANTHPNNPSSTVRVQRQTVLPRTLYSYHPLVSTSQQRICSQGTSVPYCPRDTSTQPHMALLIPGARISDIRHTHTSRISRIATCCAPHTLSRLHIARFATEEQHTADITYPHSYYWFGHPRCRIAQQHNGRCMSLYVQLLPQTVPGHTPSTALHCSSRCTSQARMVPRVAHLCCQVDREIQDGKALQASRSTAHRIASHIAHRTLHCTYSTTHRVA